MNTKMMSRPWALTQVPQTGSNSPVLKEGRPRTRKMVPWQVVVVVVVDVVPKVAPVQN